MLRRRRILMLLIALPLLGVAAAAAAIEAGLADGWLAARIESELRSRMAGRVTVAAARLRLLPPRVTIEQLAIFPPSDPGPEAPIQVASARIDLWTVDAVGARRTLGRVAVDGLRIRIEPTSEGPLNLMSLRRSTAAPSPGQRPLLLRLGIGDLHLSDALVLYHDRAFRLDSSGGGVLLELHLDEAVDRYRGNLQLRELSLRIGELDLPAVNLSSPLEYSQSGLQLEPLIFESPGIRLAGAATLRLSARPSYEVDVRELALDLPSIPALASSPVSEGLVEVSGRTRGEGADFTFEGTARSERVTLYGERVESLEAAIGADRDRLTVDDARWSYRGGTVRSAGTLEWSRARESSFEFTARQVSVPPLLARLGWSFPLPEGSAAASGAARWPGLQIGALAVAARAELRGSIGTARPLPLEAFSTVRLDRRSIRLADAVVEAEGVRVEADGELDYRGKVDLEWQGSAVSGDRLVAVAREAFGLTVPPPADRFRLPAPGNLQGRLVRDGSTPLLLDGRLQPTAFDSGSGLTARLGGTFAWQPAAVLSVNAVVGGDDFSAELSADLPASERAGELQIDLDHLPLASLAALAQSPLPEIGGRVSGSITSRLAADLEAAGPVRIDGLGVAGRVLGDASAALRWIPGDSRIGLSALRLTGPSGELHGDLSYRWDTAGIAADLRIAGLVLEELAMLPAGGVASHLDGRLRLDGRWPRLDGRLELAGPLSFGSTALGSFRLTGALDGGELDFTVEGDLAGQPLAGSGSVSLAAPRAMSSRFTLRDAELLQLWSLLGLPAPAGVEGRLGGTLTASGPALEPGRWEVAFELDRLRVAHEATTLSIENPSSIRLRDGQLYIDDLTLSDGSNRLGVAGTVEAASSPLVRLQLTGDVDLAILTALLGQGQAAGRLSVQRLDVVGPVTSPQLVGQAQVAAETLAHPDLPLPLADLTADLRFTTDQLSIEGFQASTRYGTFFASGGVFLEGFVPRRWQINAFGYGLTLDSPEGLNSRIDFDVDFSRSERSGLLSGVVYVRAAEYTRELSIADLVIMATQARAAPPGGSGDDPTVLDLEVEAYRTIRINNNLADVIASGDFRLRGTLGNPVVLGDIVIDEGRLRLDRNQYDVDRGTIRFDDPGATHPVVDLEVSTRVREYDVSLLLRGPVEQLRANVRSDPPLSTGEVVTLLATGDEPGRSAGLARTGSLAAAGAGSLLSNTVGQQTSRLFGFDRFSVDPFIDSGEKDPGARITLGKQITRDLDVTYVTKLGGQLNRQAVIVQYRITRWLTGVGSGEQDGTVAIDFKIRKRF